MRTEDKPQVPLLMTRGGEVSGIWEARKAVKSPEGHGHPVGPGTPHLTRSSLRSWVRAVQRGGPWPPRSCHSTHHELHGLPAWQPGIQTCPRGRTPGDCGHMCHHCPVSPPAPSGVPGQQGPTSPGKEGPLGLGMLICGARAEQDRYPGHRNHSAAPPPLPALLRAQPHGAAGGRHGSGPAAGRGPAG